MINLFASESNLYALDDIHRHPRLSAWVFIDEHGEEVLAQLAAVDEKYMQARAEERDAQQLKKPRDQEGKREVEEQWK